jgi:hypothetical protein
MSAPEGGCDFGGPEYPAPMSVLQRLPHGSVAGEALLAGTEDPWTIGIEFLGDALLAAELGDAVLAAQAFEDHAGLLLGREVPPGGSPDVSNGLLGTRAKGEHRSG